MKALKIVGIAVWFLATSLTAGPVVNGYANVPIAQGFSLKVNPLDSGNNVISNLFGKATPEGTIIYTFVQAGSSEPPMTNDVASNLVTGFLGQFPADFAGLVRLSSGGVGLQLYWTGQLQSALEAGGPYAPSVQTTNTLTISPLEPRRFWRSRIPMDLTPASFKANVFITNAWSDPAQTLAPGQGFIIYTPTNFTATFTGGFTPGAPTTNSIPSGWSLAASLVPIATTVTTGLNLKVNPGDRLFRLEGGIVKGYLFMPSTGWSPSEPSLSTGEAFLIYSGKPFDWETK